MSTVRNMPALTAIRGLAAWWVVLYHFKEEIPGIAGTGLFRFMAEGNLAVDLFFILSGFVIAMNYARMFTTIRWADSLHFLGLRLARIYPLHIFMLMLFLINPIALTVFSSSAHLGYRYDPGYFVLSIFLLQNWGFTHDLAWNAPAWSLSTEWGAYLLFPFMAKTTGQIARTPVRAICLMTLLLGSVVLISLAVGHSLVQDIAHLGLVRCVLEFATGVCLYHLWQARRSKLRHEGDAAAVLAILLGVAFAVLPVADFLVMPAAFTLLIYALADERSFASRAMSGALLEKIGIVSYATYLVHYFIKDWVKLLFVRPDSASLGPLLVYLVLVALSSVALYAFVEVPGRRIIRGWLAVRPRPQPATSTLPSGA
jgi:peptidoglycan/LPS O-acetylase OafA/YrhL